MADKYQLQDSSGGILLQDGSGYLILQSDGSPAPLTSSLAADSSVRRTVTRIAEVAAVNLLLFLAPASIPETRAALISPAPRTVQRTAEATPQLPMYAAVAQAPFVVEGMDDRPWTKTTRKEDPTGLKAIPPPLAPFTGARAG